MAMSGFDFSGLGGLFGGLFGNSGAPYKDASKQYDKYFDQAQMFQLPFFQHGTNAIGGFENWLGKMQDPSGFINNLMGQYQQSPYAQNLQRDALRAATNMGSATGLTGSTPLMQQAQQTAANISSQDQNQWLQNVLGINTQYGGGLQNMMNMGQNSANNISNLLSQLAQLKGDAAFGMRAGRNQDTSNIIGGLLSLFGI